MKRWIGWLPVSLAIAMSARLFGVVGALIFGALLIVLGRWPKAQTITASALALVFFIAIILFYPSLSQPPSFHAHALTDSTQQARAPSQAAGVGLTANPFDALDSHMQPANHDDSQTDVQAPPPPDAATERARWDADARAFIAAHPDLTFGDNLQVMDGYTRILANGPGHNKSNITILENPYAVAQRDPHWSFIEAAASAPRVNP